jgi:hypothetical protein
MKIRYLLPIFVVAGLVSQVQADIDCEIGVNGVLGCCWYNETDCYGYGGTYNDAKTADECRAGYGTPQDNCNKPAGIEFCRWESSCWPIESGGREGCVKDGAVYTDVPQTGVGAGKQCEGGTWTGEGKDPNRTSRGYCDWGTCVDDPDNQYSCTSGGCFEINNDQEEADCNNKVANKAACPTASLPAADRGSSPVIPKTSLAGLTVLVSDGSLHISSLKDATVSLFNMQGKQLFSTKVAAGYSVLALKEQKMGVYYAIVQSGSSKQTVKVLLK